ncbi:hypothetical protein LOK49_LG05G02862 [Camellia lanceoleosa]|uniref:Uncharacterized protein n=1 Tax=Camellia lanceoleosa TaxID=1840588 RepID=A0ACC0HU08_9ERIC|nr:hypothetical protein LOK49_LG05G02862 [Camellia lanceoleosa]
MAGHHLCCLIAKAPLLTKTYSSSLQAPPQHSLQASLRTPKLLQHPNYHHPHRSRRPQSHHTLVEDSKLLQLSCTTPIDPQIITPANTPTDHLPSCCQTPQPTGHLPNSTHPPNTDHLLGHLHTYGRISPLKLSLEEERSNENRRELKRLRTGMYPSSSYSSKAHE